MLLKKKWPVHERASNSSRHRAHTAGVTEGTPEGQGFKLAAQYTLSSREFYRHPFTHGPKEKFPWFCFHCVTRVDIMGSLRTFMV